MWEKIRAAACICAALGWWGILYPQLSLLPDTYQVISEDGTVQDSGEVVEWEFDDDIYMEILNADRSQIRFRSKLLQSVEEYLKLWQK